MYRTARVLCKMTRMKQRVGQNAMIRDGINKIVQIHFPEVQAIYLFGSEAAGDAWSNSDVDIALLLPHDCAKHQNLTSSKCRFELEKALGRPVDLLNARQVSTVMQKEIISGDCIFCTDQNALDEFEMLTLSYYQKLNEERAGILEAFRETGRAYPV